MVLLLLLLLLLYIIMCRTSKRVCGTTLQVGELWERGV